MRDKGDEMEGRGGSFVIKERKKKKKKEKKGWRDVSRFRLGRFADGLKEVGREA